MALILSLLIAYLLGSIPFARLVSRAGGVDIFSVGSGNAGFTNVWRTMGIAPALIVLVCDIGKGTLAAALGFHLAGEWGMLVAAAGAILGHTFSCFMGFRGGKGVATGAGVLLFVSPLAFFVCAVTLAGLAKLTGYMSLGSLAAAFLCPIILIVTGSSAVVTAVFTLCSLYVVWMHRSNIQRLLNGTENKIGNRKKG